MTLSFSNASASFQEYINNILVENLDIFIIVKLDNILIYNDKADYIDIAGWGFYNIQKHYLYTYLKKCRFHWDKVRFFAYIVLLQGFYMKNKKIKAVYDWSKL